MIKLDSVSEQTELKPCPFCGSKPEIKKIIIRFTPEKEYAYKVVCGNTRCQVHTETGLYASAESAVTVWNRRADNA